MTTTPKRICVLTGCQMEGLVAALQILLPESEVEGFHTYRLSQADGPEILARARACDLLLVNPLEARNGFIDMEGLGSVEGRIRFVPPVVFSAFHPDLTYLPKAGSAHVQTPLTDYNSVIAVSGFLLGLSVERTVALYNAYIYRRLGYFDLIDRCRADLVADFAEHGIDLSEAVGRWIAHPDCFMYSVNHPRAYVLADVALALCRAEGLDMPERFPCPEAIPDKLANWVMYPLFPELAERLGKQGHYRFKALSFERMNLLTLDQFVERSFRAYEAEDTTAWALPPRLDESRERIARLVA